MCTHPHRNPIALAVIVGILPLIAASAFWPSVGSTTLVFGVIGDYGSNGPAELAVSNLVTNWNPDFIVTVGDNNYPDGQAATIDDNVGQYYSNFIYPYVGSYGTGEPTGTNRFWPALGNHDWTSANSIQPYLDYFTLPGNERYYDFVRGPIHFFILSADLNEPDGRTVDSAQAAWLQSQLITSTAPWQLVILHNAPYSSGAIHGSEQDTQWPYAAWGADAVLAGHSHNYERLDIAGVPYFVNGISGDITNDFGTPVPGSQVRYNAKHGAMRVEASASQITFQFINVDGVVIDTFTLSSGGSTATPTASGTPTASATPTATPTSIGPSGPQLYLPIVLR